MGSKTKMLFNGDLHKFYIDLAKNSGMPFVIKSSNYTLEIDDSINPVLFMQNIVSNKAFSAGAKIKKDIVNSGMEKPDLTTDDLQYYAAAGVETLRNMPKENYLIDLKSAYVTVLRNYGLITADTYQYLSEIPKPDRLAAAGMLASNKYVYYHNEKAEHIATEHEVSELAEWFYFCVFETAKIMNEIKRILGDAFLLYWVDGVYFSDLSKKAEIEDYLKESNFNYTFEELTKCNLLRTNEYLRIYYQDGKGRKKYQTIPDPSKYRVEQKLSEFLDLHRPNNRTILKTYKKR